MKNNPIGIVDAGIGGFSVYQEIVRQLPQESIIYVGDNAYVPYSTLSEAELLNRAQRIIHFLLEKQVKAIVIACNTLTVSCIEQLREEFKQVPLIGTVPVVKTAAEISQTKCFGVFSTTRTANSDYQQKLIARYANGHTVINIGTDNVAPRIDKGDCTEAELHSILKTELKPFKEAKIDTLVLGCTHYPFVKNEIQAILGKEVTILDSGAAIARQLTRVLKSNNTVADQEELSQTFYTTGEAKRFDSIVKKLLDSTITSTHIDL